MIKVKISHTQQFHLAEQMAAVTHLMYLVTLIIMIMRQTRIIISIKHPSIVITTSK